MVFTTVGVSGVAWLLGGYGSQPTHVGIGSGSGAVSINNTGLVAHTDRNAITGSADISVLRTTGFTADFNSVEMSGTNLREFGLFNLSSGGTLWQREGFAAVNFDGTNELQIIITLEVF